MKSQRDRLRTVTVEALFCALAYVATFVLHIAGIGGFLTFDVKDMIIATAALAFGPTSGIIISLAVALLEMLTVSSTGVLGALMNFASSAVFSASAGIIYNRIPKIKKTFAGAVCAMAASVLSGTLTMLLMNIIITPIYLGTDVKEVLTLIPTLLLPFNLVKCLLNATLVMMVYKPVSILLKRCRITTGMKDEKYITAKTVAVLIVGAVICAFCVTVLIGYMNGKFKLI